MVLEKEGTGRQWYLTNSTSIISALETLRSEYDQMPNNLNDLTYIHSLVQKYLPILSINSRLSNDSENLNYKNKFIVNNDNDKIK